MHSNKPTKFCNIYIYTKPPKGRRADAGTRANGSIESLHSFFNTLNGKINFKNVCNIRHVYSSCRVKFSCFTMMKAKTWKKLHTYLCIIVLFVLIFKKKKPKQTMYAYNALLFWVHGQVQGTHKCMRGSCGKTMHICSVTKRKLKNYYCECGAV